MNLQQFYANEALWVKGMLEDGHARCLLGAVIRCYPESTFGKNYTNQVMDRLKAALPPDYRHSIMAFNDAEETTFADIRRISCMNL